ncbi:MAG: hypothetical protein AW10_02926 [Candidatus Accumulibacter appositus]|uniref:Cysteine-rich CWC family protein n=1 Tax=Candidatus Accumulibacter appositus TaxID=1454003 RepID=A0A011QIB4_9PROT|nr:cysteine-rich CWC family protein [Accumulibacter sp.]EXI78574.1 MAG: hypothetical protein AW10_02926 [Candidatus Accumulibacter appositus]HRF03565.1 cysteine-rich CWC family protein [Accumulibacter sp.]
MSKVPENLPESTCPDCGRTFVCGVEAGLTTCWCMQKPGRADYAPPPFTPDAGSRCYCPSCLAQRFSAPPEKPSPGA